MSKLMPATRLIGVDHAIVSNGLSYLTQQHKASLFVQQFSRQKLHVPWQIYQPTETNAV